MEPHMFESRARLNDAGRAAEVASELYGEPEKARQGAHG